MVIGRTNNEKMINLLRTKFIEQYRGKTLDQIPELNLDPEQRNEIFHELASRAIEDCDYVTAQGLLDRVGYGDFAKESGEYAYTAFERGDYAGFLRVMASAKLSLDDEFHFHEVKLDADDVYRIIMDNEIFQRCAPNIDGETGEPIIMREYSNAFIDNLLLVTGKDGEPRKLPESDFLKLAKCLGPQDNEIMRGLYSVDENIDRLLFLYNAVGGVSSELAEDDTELSDCWNFMHDKVERLFDARLISKGLELSEELGYEPDSEMVRMGTRVLLDSVSSFDPWDAARYSKDVCAGLEYTMDSISQDDVKDLSPFLSSGGRWVPKTPGNSENREQKYCAFGKYSQGKHVVDLVASKGDKMARLWLYSVVVDSIEYATTTEDVESILDCIAQLSSDANKGLVLAKYVAQVNHENTLESYDMDRVGSAIHLSHKYGKAESLPENLKMIATYDLFLEKDFVSGIAADELGIDHAACVELASHLD